MITGFIIHNNTILRVKVIILEFFHGIGELLGLIDSKYTNGRICL